MKKTLLLTMCMLHFLAADAQAADVTINMSGRFIAGPCSFTVADVDLGTYQATSFSGGMNTPWASVDIRRTNCDAMSYSAIRFVGTADPNNAQYWRATGVGGIGVELARTDLVTRVVPNVTQINWAAGTTTWPLRARLVQTTGTVTAGKVQTPITIQITYH